MTEVLQITNAFENFLSFSQKNLTLNLTKIQKRLKLKQFKNLGRTMPLNLSSKLPSKNKK